MPIYEYECNACGHRLEAFQKMSDEPLKECPECHKASLQKLVSAAGFQLKGTGWYATDFKNKGKEKTDKKSGSESTVNPSEAKSENKTSNPEPTKSGDNSSSSSSTDAKGG